jgi:hypothetical protein
VTVLDEFDRIVSRDLVLHAAKAALHGVRQGLRVPDQSPVTDEQRHIAACVAHDLLVGGYLTIPKEQQ